MRLICHIRVHVRVTTLKNRIARALFSSSEIQAECDRGVFEKRRRRDVSRVRRLRHRQFRKRHPQRALEADIRTVPALHS